MKSLKLLQKGALGILQWAVALFLIYAGWQWLLTPHENPGIVASPERTWVYVKFIFDNGTLWNMVYTTVGEAVIGFVFGLIVGLLLALAIGLLPPIVGKLVEPVVVGIYAMPKFVLAPVLFVWFGGGFEPRLYLVIIAIFPVIVIFTVTGIRTVDTDTARILELYGASKPQVARKLLIPHTMGYLTSAVTYSFPHALTIAMGAEILFGATNGIGGVLNTGASEFISPEVFAALIIGTAICAVMIGVSRQVGERLTGYRG